MSSIDSSLAIGRLQADAANQTATTNKLASEGDKADRTEIKKVADDFESLFLNMVLKSMRETVQKSGLMDGGNAEDIYRGMLDDEYAKMMATQRTTGIADQIEAFMLQAQGLPKNPPDASALGAVKSVEAQGLKAYRDSSLHNAGKSATMILGSPRATPLKGL
jgi:Rod binding domain-containing protein